MFDEFSFETLHHNAFRLTLKNYRLPVEIGALAEEHGRTQPVVITIDVWVKKTNLNDDLAAAYDYRLLPQAVDNTVAEGHIELQETLVESIARRLLVNPRVAAVRVQSTKPHKPARVLFNLACNKFVNAFNLVRRCSYRLDDIAVYPRLIAHFHKPLYGA